MGEELVMREFKPEHVPQLPKDIKPWPNWAQSMPIDLEIGAGAGLHAIRYALKNPERFLIALEKTSKAERLIRRLHNHPQIGNLLAQRCDAINWVTHQAPPQSLSRIFLLYPNPYPKVSQQNSRWPFMPFMGFLLSRLKPAGELTLATNENFYFEQAQQQMTTHWGMKIKTVELLNSPTPPRTHFEKKYLARGESCWNLVLTKPLSQDET